jgi:hypothetical protein
VVNWLKVIDLHLYPVVELWKGGWHGLENLASDVSPGKEVQRIQIGSFGWLVLYLPACWHLSSIILPAYVIKSSRIDMLPFGNTLNLMRMLELFCW